MPSIWRVENSEGTGPYQILDDNCPIDYRPDFLCENPLLYHSGNNGHPAPYNDVGIKRGVFFQEICGFKSLKQASRWFSKKEFKFLGQHGFYLKKIKVKKITAKGQHQVLAERG